jgi:HEPN domain-containing protein
MRAVTIEKSISAPVNFIVHDLADVNEQLHHGRPFFVDIARDGIALYQFEGCEFDQARPLTRADRQAEAQKYFDEWFESAVKFKRAAHFLVEDGAPKEAAFNFHQATERFYHCVLLVLSLYSPKSHKLNFLRSQAESHAPELIEVWPRDTRFAQRSFELLRRAYVDARYSPHYKITPEELEWLGERIQLLQSKVREVCERQLALG